MGTMKVKPWGKGQGDYVLINEEDFNPNIHKKLAAPKKATKKKTAKK